MANKKMFLRYHHFTPLNPSNGRGVEYFLSHQCLTLATVVDGEAATNNCVVAMTNATTYSVEGLLYALAASSTNWDCRGVTSLPGSTPYISIAFCADAAGATTVVRGTASDSAVTTPPEIPDSMTLIAWATGDLSHLTTTEAYVWDQELSSHFTYYNGYPESSMYE